jgi:hypothetical protein
VKASVLAAMLLAYWASARAALVLLLALLMLMLQGRGPR